MGVQQGVTPSLQSQTLSDAQSVSTTSVSPSGASPNVLYKYRSFTYNFTLAALKATALKSPDVYRNSSLDFVVLKSGGKTSGLNASAAIPIPYDNAGQTSDEDKNPIAPPIDTAAVASNFNKYSPGRFDMFIDNVEIDTLMAPTQESGSAIATKIKFDVIEPYSMNGFIEALRVSSQAAGHPNYVGAPFLLKVSFTGYPDGPGTPAVVTEIDQATRYFPIKLTGVQVSVTESGTKYSVTAVPYDQQGYSMPNTIIGDIKITGTTVGDILTNMISSLNEKIEQRTKDEKDPEKAKIRDKYEIYFPQWPADKAIDPVSVKSLPNNNLFNAKINDLSRQNNIFKFPPPGEGGTYSSAGAGRGSAAAAASDPRLTDSQQKEVALQQSQSAAATSSSPDKVAIMFAENSQIHDIIASVIRDSEYLRTILADVQKAKDAQGMIDYFKIHINAVPEDIIDSTTGLRIHTWQYLVMPWKVHYTKLPGQETNQHDPADLFPLVKRAYSYIYSGKNTDILSFKLDFNNLYFQEANAGNGNKTNDGTSQTAGATNDVKDVKPAGAVNSGVEAPVPSTPIVATGYANESKMNSGPQRTDPFWLQQKAAHEAILNSVSQLKAELDILGDPYFVCAGGAGNYLPAIKDPAITDDGQANINQSESMIILKFGNPSDIDTSTGLMKFDTVADFSGVYRVLKVVSTFRDGVFKQHLNTIRIPGQAPGAKSAAYETIQTPKLGSQSTDDSANPNTANSGARPNVPSLTNMVNRGTVGPGLPGVLSNFSNAVGAGSGLLNQASGVLQQGIGAITKLNNATNFGLVNPALSSAIGTVSSVARMATSGLSTVAGLAKFATSSLTSPTAALTDPAAAAQGALNNVTGAISNVPGVASIVNGGASSIDIANVKSQITSALSGNASEISAKLGIDPSQLSGLGAGLDSNVVNQIANVAKSMPAGVDLTQATNNGLLAYNLTAASIKNLPITIPPTTAPGPDVSLADALGPTAYMQALAKQINVEQGGNITPNVTSAASALPTSLSASLSNLSSLAGKAAGSLNLSPNGLLSGALTAPMGLSSIASDVKAVGVQFGSVSNAATNAAGALAGQVGQLTGSASAAASALTGNLGGVSPTSLSGPMSAIASAAGQAGTSIADLNLNSGDLTSQLSDLQNLSASDLQDQLNSYASISGIDTTNFFNSDGTINVASVDSSALSLNPPLIVSAANLNSAVSPLTSLMNNPLNSLPSPGSALSGALSSAKTVAAGALNSVQQLIT